MNDAIELNLDGLVGPTHSHAGLSHGNLASQRHRQLTSNPREAALQGLQKMKLLSDLGLQQAVLPPHERPNLEALRRLGFTGSDSRVLERAAAEDPVLLAACSSSSAMWAANAATVSPSSDSADGRVHFTPANLMSLFHRSLEAETTASVFAAIFPDETAFAHHPPLPASQAFGDEGAANHMRLCGSHGDAAIEVFVYGRRAMESGSVGPSKFPARQTFEASLAVARLHGLLADRTLFLQQNPAAIDAGAFHNDVVAVSNENVLMFHEAAFFDQARAIDQIRGAWDRLGSDRPLHLIEVKAREVPLADAVQSYLFNSQIVSLPDRSMALIAPVECRENSVAAAFVDRLPGLGTPIRTVNIVDVRQSMRNGGGPACLRLRVALTPAQILRTNPGVLFSAELHQRLTAWIEKHYREQLSPQDLGDPSLLREGRNALDELTRFLNLGSVYGFQR